MSSYAKGTTVGVERTQAEIEKLLVQYGATQFVRGWSEGRVALGFTIDDRQVRIELPLPDRTDDVVALTPTGMHRSDTQIDKALVDETRRRWRALAAVLKAKPVAVEDGISSIEREFLADIVLANGATVGQWAAPQLAVVYETATMPALLPGATE